MLELMESTASAPHLPPIPPVAPPTVDPERWEDFAGFRETFLLHFTDRPANQILRGFARMLYVMVLDFAVRHWPLHREGEIRASLRASIADLRHLQGFLTMLGQTHLEADLTWQEGHLSVLAGDKAAEVARVAQELEEALGRWPGEVA